jgi:hypothetical protein
MIVMDDYLEAAFELLILGGMPSLYHILLLAITADYN